MTKSVLAALAIALLGVPVASAEAPGAVKAGVEASQVTAKVNGMVCDFCAQAVTSVFGKEDAVDTVDVDLDSGEIRIGLKVGLDITDQRVEELVTKSGYDLVEIVRPAP